MRVRIGDASVHPAELIVYGGRSIVVDDERAAVLEAAEVPQLAELMSGMDFDTLLDARLGEVEDLYGGVLEEDDREALRFHFVHLRDFYARASASRRAVIKWL
jgi:hypothetical protein